MNNVVIPCSLKWLDKKERLSLIPYSTNANGESNICAVMVFQPRQNWITRFAALQSRLGKKKPFCDWFKLLENNTQCVQLQTTDWPIYNPTSFSNFKQRSHDYKLQSGDDDDLTMALYQCTKYQLSKVSLGQINSVASFWGGDSRFDTDWGQRKKKPNCDAQPWILQTNFLVL